MEKCDDTARSKEEIEEIQKRFDEEQRILHEREESGDGNRQEVSERVKRALLSVPQKRDDNEYARDLFKQAFNGFWRSSGFYYDLAMACRKAAGDQKSIPLFEEQ